MWYTEIPDIKMDEEFGRLFPNSVMEASKKLYWLRFFNNIFVAILWNKFLRNFVEVIISPFVFTGPIIRCPSFDHHIISILTTPGSQTPDCVVLFCHSLIGRPIEHTLLAILIMMRFKNVCVATWGRRGHGGKLSTPLFNSIGHQQDLHHVVQKIRTVIQPKKIILIGFSAGTALIANYLAEHSVDGALLISPGYGFKASIDAMSPQIHKRMTRHLKSHFLYSNKEILCLHDQEAYHHLLRATNLLEWHRYQYVFSGHENEDEYWRVFDPIRHITTIKTPIIYLNARDDRVFPENLVVKMSSNATLAPHKMTILTNHGGHVIFQDMNPIPLMYRIALSLISDILTHTNS